MIRPLLGVVSVLALAGSVVVGQPSSASPLEGAPGNPGLGDTVFPHLGNGGYQVDAYLVDMAYSDQTRMIDANVTLYARASQHLSRFNLDAAGLTIGTVLVNGQLATAVQEGEELVIAPARVVSKGSPFRVEVAYAADPRRRGGFVPTEDGFALAPQPAAAHTVFPGNDHPSDKAYFVFSLTVPAGLVGVASGAKLGSKTNPDGSITTAYFSQHPLATEVVQISVGKYTIVEHGAHDGARIRDVVPTARVARLRPALNLTPAQLTWVQQHLGKFPFEAYGLLPVDNDAFGFTGLETQTLTLYKPTFLTQTEDKIGTHMMHEIVHNWFGNSVTPRDWSDLWLNEGNANYYAFLYQYERGWTDARGFRTMVDRMRYTYSQGDIWRRDSGPVARPNAANLFDGQRYTGGTLVLYALSEKIGEDTFDEIQREYLKRHRNGNASTEDYVKLAVEISGDQSVRPFLEDWLYGTKTPPMPNHPDWTVDHPSSSKKVRHKQETR